MNNTTLQHAFSACQTIAAQHYENFPVASWLLPKKYRQPVYVIYAFARAADDIADELAVPADERLRLLSEYENNLHAALSGKSAPDLFYAVQYIITSHALPARYFFDLLSAFKQDTQQTRYTCYDEVVDYCKRSANPVGRLLLHLFNHADEQQLQWSDNICTALQLINFLQDYEQDLNENNRIYFPLDELAQFTLTEDNWLSHEPAIEKKRRAFFAFQIKRARKLLQNGAQLGKILPGRMGLEIRAIIHGGMTILTKLEQSKHTYDRPRITTFDKIRILAKALF